MASTDKSRLPVKPAGIATPRSAVHAVEERAEEVQLACRQIAPEDGERVVQEACREDVPAVGSDDHRPRDTEPVHAVEAVGELLHEGQFARRGISVEDGERVVEEPDDVYVFSVRGDVDRPGVVESVDASDSVEGRFDVEALEAHGGMGAVFRGRHRSLDSPVAIKVLPIPSTLDPDQLARFRREAMTAAKLPHPNIVSVYEFEVSGDMAYLVMPLINGPSLQAWLKKHGSMSFAEVWKLLSQAMVPLIVGVASWQEQQWADALEVLMERRRRRQLQSLPEQARALVGTEEQTKLAGRLLRMAA